MPETRIKYLIDRFFSDSITPSEHEELLLLLTEPENKLVADNFFERSWAEFKPSGVAPITQSSERMLQAILAAETNPSPVADISTNKKTWYKWLVAASITLIAAVPGYLYLHKQKPPTANLISKKIENNITPGSNRATLTLANHQQITLDEMTSGTIAQQGNVKVQKTANGQLIYQITANTATDADSISYNTISTPSGGQYVVVLPDGTKVWLNAESALTYPTAFNGLDRRVKLNGEAYFEVAKNKQKPFYVKTRNAEVQVLGTHFNISAYADEDVNKTTLLEGSVKVSTAIQNRVIQPGEQALLTGSSKSIKVSSADVEASVAWKNGYFMFDGENIQEIMKKVGRWYNVNVEYESPDINEVFGGTISKYKNINEVLKVLGETGTVHFKIVPDQSAGKGRRVIVMK